MKKYLAILKKSFYNLPKIIRTLLKIVLYIFLIYVIFYVIIPKPDIYRKYTFSQSVFDKDNKLLYMKVSEDEKYRLFTNYQDIPQDAIKALMLYEDKYFYYHFGINPISMVQAFIDALKGFTRGASSITMQTARLIFDINSSTILGKINQILRALQLELFYSKNQILEAYFNLAPYGYNIEGIGAASQIYFHKSAKDLNLNEIITITGIPQHPSKKTPRQQTENRFLKQSKNHIAKIWIDYYGSKDFDYKTLTLPTHFYSIKNMPFKAPHFSQMMIQKYPNEDILKTTLNLSLQELSEQILKSYIQQNKHLGINNSAIVIANWKTMNLEAMIGSSNYFDESILGQVNAAISYRSPGSALKPFIYGLAMEQGIIHPMTILKDVKKTYSIYRPKNIDNKFIGPVYAKRALTLSRNIPAISLMQNLQNERDFYEFLKFMQIEKLKSKEHYGLALALGGIELTMLDMVKMYALLRNYGAYNELNFLQSESSENKVKNNLNTRDLIKDINPFSYRFFSPESSFLTLDILKNTTAPSNYKSLLNKKTLKTPIYWKTGTSYSYKDGWAVGIIGQYVIVVWVGNFDGKPNNNFVGKKSAGNLFFNLAQALEKNNLLTSQPLYWPNLDVKEVDICKLTGELPNKYCEETIKSWYIPGKSPLRTSNVLRAIPISKASGKRACYSNPPKTEMKVFEFWDSDIVKAFQDAGIHKPLPPAYEKDCDLSLTSSHSIDPRITSPVSFRIYNIRIDEQKTSEIPFQAITDTNAEEVFWFINNEYLGSSKANEKFFWKSKIGTHNLIAVDNLGNSSSMTFTVELSQ